MKALGTINVKVNVNDIEYNLKLFVFNGNNNPIIGRNRINEFGLFKLSRVLNWSDEIKFVEEEEKRVKIIEEFQAVFSETLGKCNKKKFKLELKDDVTPICCKPRPLPYS